MPYASPELRRLRKSTGITSGRWAERVEVARNHYVNVESGLRGGSDELLVRCARLLSVELGRPIDVSDLIADASGDPDDEDEHEHTDVGTGPPNRGDSTGPGRLRPDMRAAS